MDDFFNHLHQYAEEKQFSGAYSYVTPEYVTQAALGYSNRTRREKNKIHTRFGIASGTKSFTAIAIAQLIESKHIKMNTPVLSILGDFVHPLSSDITIDHLLSHTSGIGDYYDEQIIADKDKHELECPVEKLLSPSDYAELIQTSLQYEVSGKTFSYSNSGYILLALIIEKVTKTPYQDFIESSIFDTAGMTKSGFFLSNNLPNNTALGYISQSETNENKLPIRGSGDGGAFSTLEDISKFWRALLTNSLITEKTLSIFWKPKHPFSDRYYGKGFYYEPHHNLIQLEGSDAGVSFQSGLEVNTGKHYTVISNTSRGAWLLTKKLRALF